MELARRFWSDYVRRYRGAYAAGVAFLVLTNLLTVAIPVFIQRALDSLAGVETRPQAAFWAWAIVVAGGLIVGARTLSRTLIFNPGRTIQFRLRRDLFAHVLTLPRAYFDRTPPGDIISRGSSDTDWVRSLVGFATLSLVNTTLTLGFALVQMARTQLTLTLLTLPAIVTAGAVILVGIRRMWSVVARVLVDQGVLSDRVLESYQGVATLHAFQAEPGATARFDAANDGILDLGLRLARLRAGFMPVAQLVGSLCVVLVLYVGGRMVARGAMTVGQIAAFIAYVGMVVHSLVFLGWGFNSIQRGWAALQRVYALLDEPAEPAPAPDSAATSAGASASPSGPDSAPGPALAVASLTFRYPSAPAGRAPALRDVTLTLAPGERLGLFGPTGAGKSTLLRLLAGLYAPPPGAVQVLGADLSRAAARRWAAQRLTFVPQEAHLFTRSVRDNIALGSPYVAPDGERPGDGQRPPEAGAGAASQRWDERAQRLLAAVVRDACLGDDLEALPEGLETLVGERGVTLSGGQRQRVALARAFFRPPTPVLLLDDVLSAVDHATERRLIDALYARAQGVTMVLASHRVSALARADRVLVLEDGRVTAQGTHDELLAQEDGPYAQAWRLQRAQEVADG